MNSLTLPPDLAQFAAEAVAAGRYRTFSDVVATGIDLVRRLETERAVFVQSLEAAEAEGDRDGWSSLEDVEIEMQHAIRTAARKQD